MRDFFVIVGSLLIAVLVAAFAVPRFIDWAPYKREIEMRIRDATGIEVALAGPLRIEILPKLALNAQDVIIDTKDAKVSAATAARRGLGREPCSAQTPHLVVARARRRRRSSSPRARPPIRQPRSSASCRREHALQVDSHHLQHHRGHPRR